MTPQQLLKQHFGHNSFRGSQGNVIDRVLNDGHALVIMPTGMGKSVCYQIPALTYGNDGDITVVVSPLIALMKDQVDGLVARGIDAAYINSSLSRREREGRYAGIEKGKFKLIYVTPERFRKPEFVEVISKRKVRLLAVDEAHCISEWGHDFRPDYTRLREFRAILGDPTTIALTATATPEVQTDIISQLGLQADEIEMFHEGIDRPNLELAVEDVWGDDDKVDHILKIVNDRGGSGIVYFTLIRILERFSELLKARGVRHLRYHGDLDRGRRKQIQDEFMGGEDNLVLATNAFGMGIDKENIRYVIHAEVPASMESYYQEIGRAGRDGKSSTCALLYDENDLTTQMEFIRWSNPNADFYRRVYDFLSHDIEKINAFGYDWLSEKLHFKSRHDHRMDTVLSMFDRYGAVENHIDADTVCVIDGLPPQLADQDRLDAKLKRDQQKLYTMVQYAKHEGDRKAFIHDYFGLPYHG